MALNLKMFDTLGMVTLVTPPSMMQGGELGFTLVNLREKEKNYFATQLNKVFPNDNVVVYIYDIVGEKAWLFKAISESKYVMLGNDAPVWVHEIIPEKKRYIVSTEQTLENTFENINKERSING